MRIRPNAGSAIVLVAAAALAGCRGSSVPTPIADTPQPERTSRAERPDRSPDRRREARTNDRRDDSSSSTPGAFDFYLLNLSWSPEFCATHASSECASRPGFVLHGLWPQNNDGTYPQNCSDAPGPSDPAIVAGLMPTASLAAHEWHTHGTCSGLNADAYFATVRKALQSVNIPANFNNRPPDQLVSPSALIGEFTAINPGFPIASFALSCGNNLLTAVEVCLSKDLQPVACQSVRSCRAGVIRVTPR